MDNIQPPIQQQTVVPITPKSHILQFILVGVVMFLLGFGGGYLLFSNNQSLTRKNQVNNISSRVQSITKPTINSSPTPFIPTINRSTSSNNWTTYQNTFFKYSISLPNVWSISTLPAQQLTSDTYTGESSFTNSITKTTMRIINNFQSDWRYDKQEDFITTSGEKMKKDYKDNTIYYTLMYDNGAKNIFITVVNSTPADNLDEIIKTLKLD